MRVPAYPRCKPSGVEWLGDIPAHWQVERLKYRATHNDDALPETTDPSFEFDYVDISSVDAASGIIAKDRMDFESAPSRARRQVRQGDTIVSTVRTYLKAIAPIAAEMADIVVSTGFTVIRPRTIDSGFLSYALRESRFVEAVVSRSVGVSYPAINASDLACISVTLPPLPEQHAIAAFLDAQNTRLDILIQKKHALIEKLQENRAALISCTVTSGLPPEAARAAGLDPHLRLTDSGIEWLGELPAHWQVKPLRFLLSKIGSGKTPRGGAESYQTDGVMLLRSQNIHEERLRLDEVVFIGPAIDADMSSTRVHGGDVLLNITGASLGRCAVTPIDLPPANVNQHVCILRPSSHILGTYLHSAMCSSPIQAQIFAAEEGTSREGLNFDQIRGILIALPPLPEQAAICRFLDQELGKIERLRHKVEAAVELLQEYRAALITAAVTGKIDVRQVLT